MAKFTQLLCCMHHPIYNALAFVIICYIFITSLQIFLHLREVKKTHPAERLTLETSSVASHIVLCFVVWQILSIGIFEV